MMGWTLIQMHRAGEEVPLFKYRGWDFKRRVSLKYPATC
jgi:hypothetical protein